MPRKTLKQRTKQVPVEGWTEGRLRSFLTGVLRSGYRRWPPKYQALKKALVGRKINLKTGRMGYHYQCNSCKQEFPTKEVQVDHINPIVDPNKGFVSWDEVINRLFCPVEELQVLCSECHSIKTKSENIIRKANSNASSQKNNKK